MAFNSCLANLYRDGTDSMGFHSDDEPELGPEPTIASISLGARRRFVLRHRATRERWTWELGAGDLLVMRARVAAGLCPCGAEDGPPDRPADESDLPQLPGLRPPRKSPATRTRTRDICAS